MRRSTRGVGDDWPRGRPLNKHRHYCELCTVGLVMWTSEEECSPVHLDHQQGACAKCRRLYGSAETRRRLRLLRQWHEQRARDRERGVVP